MNGVETCNALLPPDWGADSWLHAAGRRQTTRVKALRGGCRQIHRWVRLMEKF